MVAAHVMHRGQLLLCRIAIPAVFDHHRQLAVGRLRGTGAAEFFL
jgi:hypothetical protein